ncbi:MAG: hypothetical protein KDJ80_04285 [Nitratireductor sp.]|nr:hypothetical protein [Nitratireductor sp.]
MNVLFDNCTAPLMASTLDGFISHYQHRAFHIKDISDLPKGRHSSDIEWIEHLRQAPEEWIFISGDHRIRKNPAEKAAFKKAGLHGFVLAPAYQKSPMHQIAATIIWKWPEVLQVTNLLSAPSMHEIPIGKNTKLKQLFL